MGSVDDRYPPGVPCWVDLPCRDPEAAARFYAGVFGWSFPDAPAESHTYLVALLGDAWVAAITTFGDGRPERAAWTTFIRVASADEAAARVRDAGGSVLGEPSSPGEGGRMAVVADPEGAVFCLWEAHAFPGAGLVNAPGSWNWSDLHAADLDAAEAFYAAVFGWETQPVDFGGAEARMWRLPGYGDVLARRDPGIRERHAEAGVPPGFTDAIGWLQPASEGTAPRWSVTFAVDDADGAARRAADLGGTVTVPPFDAGPARVAVLGDPEGAAFVVSHYDPARAT